MFFDSYAQYYDLLYQDKDYDAEIEFLKTVAAMKAGDSILDLGCGTGGHDIPLAKQGLTGVDLSERMVRQARQKVIETGLEVTFTQGDIRTLRLGKTFDVVISMFAVMGYQVANADFLAALQTARAHMPVGRLFVFDAWFGPAVLGTKPETRVKEIPSDGKRVIRIAEPQVNSSEDTVTVHYTVLRLEKDKVLDETREAHPMRFFFIPEVALFAQTAGFEVSKICPFMDPNRQVTDRDWNVTWVLTAV